MGERDAIADRLAAKCQFILDRLNSDWTSHDPNEVWTVTHDIRCLADAAIADYNVSTGRSRMAPERSNINGRIVEIDPCYAALVLVQLKDIVDACSDRSETFWRMRNLLKGSFKYCDEPDASKGK